MLNSTRRCEFLILSLLQCHIVLISFLRAVKRKVASYIVRQSLRRASKLVANPQSTTLNSTGNISAEDSVHKNKVGHNNTRGIVSSLLFFPLNLLLRKVCIFIILCGLRL
jgi:hypothetical protein